MRESETQREKQREKGRDWRQEGAQRRAEGKRQGVDTESMGAGREGGVCHLIDVI